MLIPPLKVLAPDKLNVPAPPLINLPDPEISPEIIFEELQLMLRKSYEMLVSKES